jgi:hypothetical protein
MPRLPASALPRFGRRPHPDVPLGTYRHYKTGADYVVAGGVFRAEDESQRIDVLYVSESGYVCYRSVENFTETVGVDDGEDVPRFLLVAELTPMAAILRVAHLVLTAFYADSIAAVFGDPPAGR